MNPCELLLRSTAPYYREARVTFVRRQTACGVRHCCARRIVECLGRRRLVCTSTRWAERHPQGVCRIRKAAEPPTAAQQRMIEAEANRLAMLNAATPRYGQCNRQALQLFELLACNGGVKGQSPLRSLGGPRGIFSHVREYPPYSVQRHWRCFPRGAARRLKLWEQVNDLRKHEKRRLNA